MSTDGRVYWWGAPMHWEAGWRGVLPSPPLAKHPQPMAVDDHTKGGVIRFDLAEIDAAFEPTGGAADREVP